MNRNKVCFVAAVVLLALIVFCALAWANNVSVAMKWDIMHSASSANGCFPWFDKFAKDLSTFCTLIPLVGTILIFSGVIQIWREHHGTASEYFPFFHSHRSVTIAMGLIGTMIGFTLLSSQNMEADSELWLPLIMGAFGTALYSSLSAFVWVFLVAQWVSPLMRYYYNRTTIPVETEDMALVELVERAGNGTALFGDKAFAAANMTACLYVQLDALTVRAKASVEALSGFDTLLGGMQKTATALKEAAEAMTTNQGTQQQTLAKYEQAALKALQAAERAVNALNREHDKRTRSEARQAQRVLTAAREMLNGRGGVTP